MPYDDRLHLVQHFEIRGLPRTNRLKIVNQGDYLQLYLSAPNDGYASMRLDKELVEQLREYLEENNLK